jgi:hypothetical protein
MSRQIRHFEVAKLFTYKLEDQESADFLLAEEGAGSNRAPTSETRCRITLPPAG